MVITPEIAALAGGGMEAGGSVFSSLVGLNSAKAQMKFQERMSSSAHQREVEDLKKADLNPILSVTGGHGASTPSGSMFTPDNPFRGATATALQTVLNKQQIKQMEIQNQKLAEEAKTQLSIREMNEAAKSASSAAAVKLATENAILSTHGSNQKLAEIANLNAQAETSNALQEKLKSERKMIEAKLPRESLFGQIWDGIIDISPMNDLRKNVHKSWQKKGYEK